MADYNINAVTRRAVFTGSAGLGPYAFTFEILDQDDLAVYFNATKLTLTTDYTVSINANGTGSVTIVTGTNVPSTPTASDTITILGARDIERTTDFVTAGDLLASSLNEQLDALTIFDQQLAEEGQRSMRAPVFDPAFVADGGTLDMTLPSKADRVDSVMAFDTDGNPVKGPTVTGITTITALATDIGTLADIEDGTVATDAISDTAAIASDVSTVAGVAANVTTVAGNTTNINTVATDLSGDDDIGTVATNIASVNTVATNIADVVTVANDLNEAISEIETAADDLNEAVSEIDTVATNIANVNAVGNDIANVNTVATNIADVNTVAGIQANVTTVAGISSNVTTVAGISADVTTVAADGTDIGTVATNISNVNTVAGNNANINTVAGISSNVTTVAGISSDITAVAGDATDIGTVATDLAGSNNIGTVAGAISNVNAVGADIANVNTTAANIAGVNSFAERYRVGASDPTTSLDEGDLAYNSTDNALKYYDGTSWSSITAGLTDIVADVTPQLGGDLDTNGNDINFGDNDKAIFGAGSDLQIYHNPAQGSFIEDAGAGNLILKGTSVVIDDSSGDRMATFVDGGAVTLNHGSDASARLATTSTGVDITGTVTADDNITLEGASTPRVTLTDTTNTAQAFLEAGNTVARVGSLSNHSFEIRANNDLAIEVKNDGDITFFGDDEVTQGLRWDASTQRLGLGTTAPNGLLELRKNSAAPYFVINRDNNKHWGSSVSSGGNLAFQYGTTYANMIASTAAMTITSGGSVGIGTASPSTSHRLTLDSSSNYGGIQLKQSGTQIGQIIQEGGTGNVYIDADSAGTGGGLILRTNGGSEAARIDSSQNLLVGTTATSPAATSSSGTFIGSDGRVDMSAQGQATLRVNRNTSDGTLISLRRQGSQKGTISITTTGATYNTTSDLRLKTDIEPIDHATDMLMAMNPVSHRWKADPDADAVVGFIAQEMQEIVPEAVSGDADSDEMMSMDYGRITPVLVAALQDAHKKIEQLEQRIADMENN